MTFASRGSAAGERRGCGEPTRGTQLRGDLGVGDVEVHDVATTLRRRSGGGACCRVRHMIAPPVSSVVVAAHCGDVAGALALIDSGLFGDYMTYQGQGVRYFAGDVEAEVVMDRRAVRSTSGGRSTRSPLGRRPMRTLGDAVTTTLAGQRAFGYLTFELAHLVHGSDALGGVKGLLAHLFVPKIAVAWSADMVVVTGADRARVDTVVGILQHAAPARAHETTDLALTSAGGRDAYESAVREVIGAIRRHMLRKAIISRRIDVPFTVNLVRTYAAGLQKNTPARSFLFRLGGRRCAGFSPEMVAEVGTDGSVSTQPLAGTRPLLHRADADRRLREELEWDVKECYEHVISARLAGDELRGVCAPETVAIHDLLAVCERGTVQHLASRVAGRLEPGRDAWDAIEALFPSVTASGIPKRPALRMIASLEGDRRDLYAGAVCVVEPTGALEAALTLRSVYQDEDGATWLRAGAGIVADSDPATEYDETTSKLSSVSTCLVTARSVEGAGRQSADRAAIAALSSTYGEPRP